jgi:hypothetical protein
MPISLIEGLKLDSAYGANSQTTRPVGSEQFIEMIERSIGLELLISKAGRHINVRRKN